jgi:hypothetical protein
VLAIDIDKFLSELGWREFCCHLLFDAPDLAERNWQGTSDAFPWRQDEEALAAWQRGRTGYPIVDAGMRELWHSGVMHNRGRMVAASFLVKHLLIDWREGERWFWDTLVDADAGSNPANWQWIAGSGADAAPYFAGRKVRSRRRLCAALGARTGPPARAPDPPAMDGHASRARERRRGTRPHLSGADHRPQGRARPCACGVCEAARELSLKGFSLTVLKFQLSSLHRQTLGVRYGRRQADHRADDRRNQWRG